MVKILNLVSILVILSIPFATLSFGDIGIKLTATNIFLMLFVLIGSIYTVKKGSLSFSGAEWLLALFVIVAFYSACFSPYSTLPVAHIMTLLSAITLFWVGKSLADVKRMLPYWENAVFLTAFLSSIIAFGHYFSLIPVMGFEKDPSTTRSLGGLNFDMGVTGLIYGSSNYGMWLEAGIMVGLRWIFECRRKYFGILGISVFVLAIVFSLSRSSWIAVIFLLLASLFIPTLANKKNKKDKGRYIVGILFWGGLTITVMCASFYDVIGKAVGLVVDMQEASIYLRIQANGEAISGMLEAPIFGLGPNMMSYVSSHHLVHNTFLAVGVSYGVIALILFTGFYLVLLISPYSTMWLTRNHSITIRMSLWFVGFLAFTIEMMLFSGVTSKIFWILAGLLYGEVCLYKQCTPREEKVVRLDLRKFRG